MYVGAVDDVTMKLLINDFPKREHFDAEHNVANAIFMHNSHFSLGNYTQKKNFIFEHYSMKSNKKIHAIKFIISSKFNIKLSIFNGNFDLLLILSSSVKKEKTTKYCC